MNVRGGSVIGGCRPTTTNNRRLHNRVWGTLTFLHALAGTALNLPSTTEDINYDHIVETSQEESLSECKTLEKVEITSDKKPKNITKSPDQTDTSSLRNQISDSVIAPNVLNLDRPVSDKSLYRHVVLPNNLQAILISDPECDKAACSLNVRVGSLFNPPELPGLAHFLEHMCFLGTEKYPDEAEYFKFLSEHGGDSNAFTASDKTNYYFAVSPEHLDGAVDRFAQFFLSPLFTESATERQLNAVDSEHNQNLLSDVHREWELWKYLSNPNHPHRAFVTGDNKTLRDIPKEKGIDVRKALLAFHKKYYSANLMQLCIVGRESLDDLEAMIRKDRFELVKNTGIQIPQGEEIGAPEVPYREEDLGKIIRVVPVRDTRTISFTWILPEQTKLWESKPTRYLTHLLGHEGKGSLLSALKAEGLATAISANQYDLGVSTLYVEITPEDKAMDDQKSIDRIAQLLHQYLKMVADTPIKEWILDEIKQISDTQFKFRPQPPPMNRVLSVSQSMYLYPPTKLLSGYYLTWKRDLDEIRSVINFLTPKRAIVQLTSKSFESKAKEEGWETEPYYQTRFKVEPLSEDIIDKWCKPQQKNDGNLNEDETHSVSTTTLDFPKPNAFLPRTLELKERPISKELMPKQPQLLQNNLKTRMRAFFKQDNSFDLPHALVNLRFASDSLPRDPKSFSIAELYMWTVQELINEVNYDATVAGLYYGMNNADEGFNLKVTGFNDRLPDLVKTLCQAIRKPELNPKAFEIAKGGLCRYLRACSSNRQPYERASQLRRKFLQIPTYLPNERLPFVEKITYEDICEMAKSNFLLQGLSVDALILGNITEKEAHNLLNVIDVTLSENQNTKKDIINHSARMKVADLRDGEKLVRIRAHELAENPDETNNAVLLGIQVGPCSYQREALLNVAELYIENPIFDALRTKQGIGYKVRCYLDSLLHCSFLELFVVSPVLKPESISERIEAFLEEYLTKPEKYLSEETFEKLKQSAISLLKEKSKSLEEENIRHYDEIRLRRFQFDIREKKIEFLRTATREQFIEFLKTSLHKAPWFTTEIESQKEPTALSISEHSAVDYKPIPLKPSNPVVWENVGNDTEKFISTHAKQFYEFPLPGGQITI